MYMHDPPLTQDAWKPLPDEVTESEPTFTEALEELARIVAEAQRPGNTPRVCRRTFTPLVPDRSHTSVYALANPVILCGPA